ERLASKLCGRRHGRPAERGRAGASAGRQIPGHHRQGYGPHRRPGRRAALRLRQPAAPARRFRCRARRHGGQGARREDRDGPGHGREPHPLPAVGPGRHHHLGDGSDAGTGEADHVHGALRQHIPGRVRPEIRERALRIRSRKPEDRRRQRHDAGARHLGHEPAREPDAHRRRRHRGRRLYLGAGGADRHEQHRGAGAREAEPVKRVRPQIRHPAQPGPYGGTHGRTQSRPLARRLHLLQHHERRAGAPAPQISRHADGPAADAL
ncbi:MAG: hypothetical protein AVDCRST_MAG90-2562, partial [uncultured Microvirga sp.]